MNGIFCLEGFWYGDHRDKTTVRPVLDLLNCYQKLPFIHHRCGTKAEFKHSIERWKTKGFHSKYPILALAFHGEPGKLLIGKDEISLLELEEILGNKCQRSIIYFGSCATMKWDHRSLQSFLKRTEMLAVMGYTKDVDWLPSASFEVSLLSKFMKTSLTSDNIQKVKGEIENECKSQVKSLQFRFVLNEKLRFTEKRTKVISR